MKKLSALLLIAFLLGNSFVFGRELTNAQLRKCDPVLHLLMTQPKMVHEGNIAGTALKDIHPDKKFSVFIITNGAFSGVRSVGAETQAVIGDVATARITAYMLADLVALEEVNYIEAPRYHRPTLDVASVEVGALNVHTNNNIKGKGVIIGLIDTGIDWQHPDFRNPDGTTRIKYLLDFSDPGIDPYNSTLYTEAEINAALFSGGTCDEQDVYGHGTHIAGCAVGSGRATGEGQPAGQYVGVAPEANLVVVKATRNDSHQFVTTDELNALNFIDQKATELGMPYVVNMSFGGHFGAHDGTSSLEKAIDQLTGPGKPGKAVVVSAGNDRDDAKHVSGTFGTGATLAEIELEVDEYTPNEGNDNDIIYTEFWCDASYDYWVRVITPSGGTSAQVNPNDGDDFNHNDGWVYISNGQVINEKNAKQIYVYVRDLTESKPPASGTWTIKLYGTKGRFDGWIGSMSMTGGFTNYVDSTSTVAIPGTGVNAITVGAYLSKKVWTDFDGNNLHFTSYAKYRLGALAPFSSIGPTRDGRLKPDITAPGSVLEAAKSIDADVTSTSSAFYGGTTYPNAFLSQDGVHAIAQGTSVSAPIVTGVVALLFERDPGLDAAEVKQLLFSTGRSDATTGPVPNNNWGYGKIDASVATDVGNIVDHQSPVDFKVFPNYPNPFATQTLFRYELPVTLMKEFVEIKIYDTLGREVRTLHGNSKDAKWDGKGAQGQLLSSGVYYYKIFAGNHTAHGKVLLLR